MISCTIGFLNSYSLYMNNLFELTLKTSDNAAKIHSYDIIYINFNLIIAANDCY